MDDNVPILIVVIAILIIMSAYFSATETAFSSLNKIKLKNLKCLHKHHTKLDINH